MSYSHVIMKSCSRDIQISYPLVFMLRFACSVVTINELWHPGAPHYQGRLIYRSLALGPSRSCSCSFIICLSHSVISYHCGNGLMASGSLEIVLLCYCALFLPYDLDILLAWHYARMLSCSHNPRCHYALALSCSHGLMSACSQSPPVTYVQRDAPSLSRFPFLDSTGFRPGANPS